MKIPGLTILDKYIIRKFLNTFVLSIGLIIIIVIIFDISEKLDDFIERHVAFRSIVFDYYVNFIPYFVNLFSPLFTFISVIFFSSKMAANTEIVAMLASGSSFNRVLRPYIVAASILALATFILNGWIIPRANVSRVAFENAYIGKPGPYEGYNIHRQLKPGLYVYMENFNSNDKIGYKFSLEKFNGSKLESKLMADLARWDSSSGKWQLNNYFIRILNNPQKEKLISGVAKDTLIPFDPMMLTREVKTVQAMDNQQLDKFIELEKLRGSEQLDFYYIEKYQRSASPAAIYILTIIGVALSSRKVRGGIGLQLGMGLGLGFTYILFMQVSNTFATNGGLHPLIAVWIPNFIFAAIAYVLYRLAPK